MDMSSTPLSYRAIEQSSNRAIEQSGNRAEGQKGKGAEEQKSRRVKEQLVHLPTLNGYILLTLYILHSFARWTSIMSIDEICCQLLTYYITCMRKRLYRGCSNL